MKNQPTQEQANSALECILGQKTVGFYPVIAKALGSAPAAIMVSQAFFWQYKAKFGSPVVIDGEQYFSKTVAEWYEETSVTESAQRLARSILVKHGIMVEKLAGLPATMHFRVDINSLVAVINGYLSNGITVAAKHGNKKPQLSRTGSGKFRQQEAANDGDIYIETSETNETIGEGKRCATTTPQNEIKPDQTINENPKKPNNFTGRGAEKKTMTYTPKIHPENEPHFAYFSDPGKAKAAWTEWIEYKHSQHRQKYKEAKSELTKLRQLFQQFNGDSAKFEAAINYSIGNLYSGVFAPKIENGNGKFQHIDKAQQQHLNLARFVADIHSGAAFADAGKVEIITGE